MYFASFDWHGETWPSQTAIAQHLGLSVVSVARLVKSLESGALVRRHSRGDGIGLRYEIVASVHAVDDQRPPSELEGAPRSRGFLKVPNGFLRSPIVPPEVKAYALYLHSFSYRGSWPSQAAIKRDLGVSIARQRRYVAALEDAGFLVCAKRFDRLTYAFVFETTLPVASITAKPPSKMIGVASSEPDANYEAPPSKTEGATDRHHAPLNFGGTPPSETEGDPHQIRCGSPIKIDGTPPSNSEGHTNPRKPEPRNTTTNPTTVVEISKNGPTTDRVSILSDLAALGVRVPPEAVHPLHTDSSLREWLDHFDPTFFRDREKGGPRSLTGWVAGAIRQGIMVSTGVKDARRHAAAIAGEFEAIKARAITKSPSHENVPSEITEPLPLPLESLCDILERTDPVTYERRMIEMLELVPQAFFDAPKTLTHPMYRVPCRARLTKILDDGRMIDIADA